METFVSIRNELFKIVNDELVWVGTFKEQEDCEAVANALNSNKTLELVEL